MRTRFIVLRHPILMEDEGFPKVLGVFSTRKAAEIFVEKQVGYFSLRDFSIIETKELD